MTVKTWEYRERVKPSVWWWLVAAVISAMTSLIVFPVWKIGGVIVPVVVFIAVALTLRSLIPTITVTHDHFYAGPAHIDRKFITTVTALEKDAAFKARGQDLDARAFLFTRPWAPGCVRIDIDDPGDPTPYWIVSSHRPGELAAALAR